MNNPIRKFRKFFVKPKKMNATAVRNAAASTYDEETDDTKLSGAFIIVLILHIVAVVGIVAFTRIKENRKNAEAPAVVVPTKKKESSQSQMAVAGIGSKAPQLAPDVPQTDAPAIENNPPKILPSTGGQIHVVKQDETLARIAYANGTSVAELVKLNGLKGSDDLNIGQALNLPDKNSLPPLPAVVERRNETVKNSPPRPTTPTSKSGTYTIRKGDSLVGIARENGVSYAELTKANKGVDPKKIQPGQTLKLPPKK